MPDGGSTADAAILAAVAEVARDHLGWTAPITRETRLVETLALDSIRQLTLIIEIENRFRVRLDDEEAAAMETAGDLVDVLRRKCTGGGPDAG